MKNYTSKRQNNYYRKARIITENIFKLPCFFKVNVFLCDLVSLWPAERAVARFFWLRLHSVTNISSKCLIGFLIIFFLPACANELVGVNVTIIDQRTALENQVLGSYEDIGKDMILLASVRSVDESGKLKEVDPLPAHKKEAIRARQRMEFNRDDIEYFKSLYCAGENNEGLLTFFEIDKTRKDPEFAVFVKTLIQEENADRLIIFKRIVMTNENFNEDDLPKVKKIFASLNRDNAKKEEQIQQEDGKWVRKK